MFILAKSLSPPTPTTSHSPHSMHVLRAVTLIFTNILDRNLDAHCPFGAAFFRVAQRLPPLEVWLTVDQHQFIPNDDM